MNNDSNRFWRGFLEGVSWAGRVFSLAKFMRHTNDADRVAHIVAHMGTEVLINELKQDLDEEYEFNKETEQLKK